MKKVGDELSEFDVKQKRKECLEDLTWKKQNIIRFLSVNKGQGRDEGGYEI